MIIIVKFLEYWIMNKDGIPYVYRKANDNIKSMSEYMIGGFFSAFSHMVQESSNQTIEAMKFADSKLIIFPAPKPAEFYSIARVSLKEKDKNIKKEMIKINQQFIDDYWLVLQDWVGNIDIFFDFKQRLKDYM